MTAATKRTVPASSGKRRAPFSAKFKVKLENLIQTQRDRWNDGYLRAGTEPWEVAFHLFDEDHATRSLFRELNLDENDPFHWRVLVEAFAQTFVAELGAPKKISKEEDRRWLLKLARDADAVRREQFHGKWRPSLIVDHLRTKEPYRSRYRDFGRHALRKRLGRLVRLVGPMDDDVRERAWDIFSPPHSRNPFIETIEELDEQYEAAMAEMRLAEAADPGQE